MLVARWIPAPARVLSAMSSVPPFVQSHALAAIPGVRHGFFGRKGGVSTGIYASLNTGPGSADAPAAIAANRACIAAALGVTEPERLLTANQVHSAIAIAVSAPFTDTAPRPKADALVTTTRGLALGALAADCAPVLMADGQGQIIAAVHAGWRGALSGVTDAAIDAMVDLGADRASITAAIGPCISQTAYEVGPEFRTEFVDHSASNAKFFAAGAGDRSQFDLKWYVETRLLAAGVATVEILPPCTRWRNDAYFSHRASRAAGDPDYGRNLSVIALDQ